MSKYFNDNKPWTKELVDYKGLPRPFFSIPKDQQYKDNEFYLHPKVPVPWQSEPIFSNGRQLGIIYENEESVYPKNLCPYCGLSFMPDDNAVRWTGSKKIPTKEGPSILSDSFPFHLECMKQGRIFCPFMRNVSDEEFEYGSYGSLRVNAILYMKKNGII